MKRNYVSPDMEVIETHVNDILAGSDLGIGNNSDDHEHVGDAKQALDFDLDFSFE